MAKIIKFPLQRFFHSVYEAAKKRQDDIQRKKTEFLFQEAYRFFLDIYLTNVVNRGVDFPDFMYEAGQVICNEAMHKAEEAMLYVIKNNRINECYSRRIKELKKMGCK